MTKHGANGLSKALDLGRELLNRRNSKDFGKCTDDSNDGRCKSFSVEMFDDSEITDLSSREPVSTVIATLVMRGDDHEIDSIYTAVRTLVRKTNKVITKFRFVEYLNLGFGKHF